MLTFDNATPFSPPRKYILLLKSSSTEVYIFFEFMNIVSIL